jgi:hypothetical protein
LAASHEKAKLELYAGRRQAGDHGVRAKRPKSGTISFDLVEGEGAAAMQRQ